MFPEYFASLSGYDDLKKFAKTTEECFKELASALHERLTLESEYGKSLQKISQKIQRIATLYDVGSTSKSLCLFGEQISQEAEIHRNTMHMKLNDTMYRPLKDANEMFYKNRKKTQEIVSKPLKDWNERRTEEYKAKTKAISSALEVERLEKMLEDIKNDKRRVSEKEQAKLKKKMRQALDTLDRADKDYHDAVTKLETGRQQLSAAVYKSAARFQWIEQEKIEKLREVIFNYLLYVGELPGLIAESCRELREVPHSLDSANDISAVTEKLSADYASSGGGGGGGGSASSSFLQGDHDSISSASSTAFSSSSSSHNTAALAEINLMTYYAQDMDNSMSRERRKGLLSSYNEVLKLEIENVKTKQREMERSLGAHLQNHCVYSGEETDDVIDSRMRLCSMNAMMLFLEASKIRCQGSLDVVNGGCRPSSYLDQYTRTTKDKTGASSCVLIPPVSLIEEKVPVLAIKVPQADAFRFGAAASCYIPGLDDPPLPIERSQHPPPAAATGVLSSSSVAPVAVGAAYTASPVKRGTSYSPTLNPFGDDDPKTEIVEESSATSTSTPCRPVARPAVAGTPKRITVTVSSKKAAPSTPQPLRPPQPVMTTSLNITAPATMTSASLNPFDDDDDDDDEEVDIDEGEVTADVKRQTGENVEENDDQSLNPFEDDEDAVAASPRDNDMGPFLPTTQVTGNLKADDNLAEVHHDERTDSTPIDDLEVVVSHAAAAAGPATVTGMTAEVPPPAKPPRSPLYPLPLASSSSTLNTTTNITVTTGAAAAALPSDEYKSVVAADQETSPPPPSSQLESVNIDSSTDRSPLGDETLGNDQAASNNNGDGAQTIGANSDSRSAVDSIGDGVCDVDAEKAASSYATSRQDPIMHSSSSPSNFATEEEVNKTSAINTTDNAAAGAVNGQNHSADDVDVDTPPARGVGAGGLKGENCQENGSSKYTNFDSSADMHTSTATGEDTRVESQTTREEELEEKKEKAFIGAAAAGSTDNTNKGDEEVAEGTQDEASVAFEEQLELRGRGVDRKDTGDSIATVSSTGSTNFSDD